jgi:hypothetical protein
MPWSGYWWPTAGGELANGYSRWGHPAPLEKYELLVNGSYPGQITEWELKNNYDPDAPSWYGQCHAWAAAAAMENITFFPSSYENIIFRVGDKKGLLTACHGSDLSVRESGEAHVFHEWLLLYIKENGKSFVADIGGPNEAWFYPVYKYELNTVQNGDVTSVTCQIWYADDRVEPDFQGTKVKTRAYTYDLYVNGSGEITGGEWTGTSIYSPPKSLFFPLSPESTNPYISDTDYQTIKDIALHTDDFLEDDSPVRLLQGNYNLILLNEDLYTIECRAGDTIWLDLAKLDDFQDGIQVKIEDAMGNPIMEDTLEEDMSLSMPAENPPYTLSLFREDYGGGGIYSLRLDLKKAYEFVCPNVQKDGWNGFALTNSSDSSCPDIHVVAYNETGEPVATVMEPLTLYPGEKKTFLLSQLSIRSHEWSSVFSIKIVADRTLSALYLGGLSEENMSGLGRKRKGRRFVLPDTSSMYNAGKYVSWSLYNGDINPVSVNMQIYSEEGIMRKETSLELAENSLNRYTPTNNPFNTDSDNDWIMIETDGQRELEGYIRWTKDGSGGADSMFALTSMGTRFFVPHVALSDLWSTEVTLINLSDTENKISLSLVDGEEIESTGLTLSPFEKRSVMSSELFPGLGYEILNQSALIITSLYDTTGYFSYKTGGSSAYYILATDEQTGIDLMVPHIASDDYWWTGVAIFNSTDQDMDVELIPYNYEGVPITQGNQQLTLAGHKKRTFTIRDLFSSSPAGEISWVKIRPAADGLCGLFLYGDIDVNLLSGSELYNVETD